MRLSTNALPTSNTCKRWQVDHVETPVFASRPLAVEVCSRFISAVGVGFSAGSGQ